MRIVRKVLSTQLVPDDATFFNQPKESAFSGYANFISSGTSKFNEVFALFQNDAPFAGKKLNNPPAGFNILNEVTKSDPCSTLNS